MTLFFVALAVIAALGFAIWFKIRIDPIDRDMLNGIQMIDPNDKDAGQ